MGISLDASRPPPNPQVRLWAALSLVTVVVAAWLLPADLFLSAPGTDLIGQFAAWREFAAENIRAGHFPLWNPYTYSGQPFLGDFQSSMLYPPNVIFLFLPLARAANLCVFLHLLILGWGMGRWAAQRGLDVRAATLCGFVAPLSGAVFPHVYAGHLASLCSMAWAPWIFLGLESSWRSPSLRPLLLAAAAVCLQILAGHVQYVFYTAIAAGLHALVYSVADPLARRRALPAVAVVYLGAAALAAAQLLPGYAAGAESVRQGSLDYHFVSMFSFAPENLLTLVAPGFFGNLASGVYWGRCYLWEMSAFAGVAGLLLAGVALGDRLRRRTVVCDLIIAALLFILALGGHTPLLHPLYDYVPGFDRFRTLAKFIFPATLFGVLILGAGADALIHRRLPGRVVPITALLAGLLCAIGALVLLVQPESVAGFLRFIQQTHESYLPDATFADAGFLHNTGFQAGQSLALAATLLIILGGALLNARAQPWLRWLPLLVLPLEMLGFAWTNLGVAHTSDLIPGQLQAYVAGHPGDYRVLDFNRADNGFFLGAPDLWGNDPTVLKRYAEFITFTQGGQPDKAGQYVKFQYLPPLYALLRYRYAFLPDGAGYKVYEAPNPLPRALLVTNYQVQPTRDAIFSAMTKPGFDPRQTVLLESDPSPRPSPGATPGTVHVLATGSDSLTLEADTPAPALLLITDLYSRDWSARPLPGSSQDAYQILPADYVVRAIPLAAGHHHLIVEYAPPSWPIGLALSTVAWLAWLGLFWRSRRPPLRLGVTARAGLIASPA
jgi:hypothetical protein